MFIFPSGDATTRNNTPGPVPKSATDEANQLIKQYGSAAAALSALENDPPDSLDAQDRQAMAILRRRAGTTGTASSSIPTSASSPNASTFKPVQGPFTNDQVIEEEVKAFGPYTPAMDFLFTSDRIVDYLDRLDQLFPDIPPGPIQPWEMRLGLCKFVVPPLNINVSKQFATGNLGGSGIRQGSSLKFNSGHSETMIEMTLYFPNTDSLWGFAGNSETINFDDPNSIPIVDQFASSLRGLITQFKYSPILPIANQYLNQVHGITGVCLLNMTLSTLDGYPFVIAVKLDLLRFNHQIFIPMIPDFNSAINYGRFRHYLGRGANRLENLANQDFLTSTPSTNNSGLSLGLNLVPHNDSAAVAPQIDYGSTVTFDKLKDIKDGTTKFDFYFPDHDPNPVVVPSMDAWSTPIAQNTPAIQSTFEKMLNEFGLDPIINPSDFYARYGLNSIDPANLATSFNQAPGLARALGVLNTFVTANQLAMTEMKSDQYQAFLKKYLQSLGPSVPSATANKDASDAWAFTLYTAVVQNPNVEAILKAQQQFAGTVISQEWEVPMRRLGLDPQSVIVQGITVSLGNQFARMQLQMEDNPTYQHISARDTQTMLSFLIVGPDADNQLILLRNMFDFIQGLARIEHGHAVLGFLGFKNLLSTLSGMKWALPQSFEVDTVPGFPHIYQVNISLVDFDIFQQKRETLSVDQQYELIQAFSKRNPFLRIKQLWSSFSAYPDFPLAIRADGTQQNSNGDSFNPGTVLGYLDPDFYFHTYDSPINNGQGTITFNKSKDPADPFLGTMDVVMGNLHETNPQTLHIDGTGIAAVKDGDTVVSKDLTFNEPHAGNTLVNPRIPGMTPPGDHVQPHTDGGSDPFTHHETMLQDWQYRDLTGRMIQAFPTYMLWLINDNGTFGGVKLFDDFYGLQSVLDFSVLQSEDCLSDSLILRVSNLYNRLTTNYQNLLDPTIVGGDVANVINNEMLLLQNSISGMQNVVVNLETVKLAPGARLHLKAGFSSNPNLLHTIFQGVVTNVEAGDIVTLTGQSDSVELTAIVNDVNPNASSGSVDGSLLAGFYMSEPRDLIVRLMTMGGSRFQEAVANATHGLIFSQNKYGIRHFGSIIYGIQTPWEQRKLDQKRTWVEQKASQTSKLDASSIVSGVEMVIPGLYDVAQQLWVNFTTRRDYEVFMRNIYPGNGTGIAQYMGGDIGDGGISMALAGTGVSPNSDPNDQNIFGLAAPPPDNSLVYNMAAQLVADNEAALQQSQTTSQRVASDLTNAEGSLIGATIGSLVPGVGTIAGAVVGGGVQTLAKNRHPFATLMGLDQEVTDEVPRGFSECSFRANTYMKTVWDLFVLCAGLLPNYIIAVRPFEERSTVFYGKPHWNYTSGLIPVTTGIDETNPPPYAQPDSATQSLIDQANLLKSQQETPEQFANDLFGGVSVTAGSPTAANPSLAGNKWQGGDPSALPTVRSQVDPGTPDNATLPSSYGILSIEMHLPTSLDLQTDISQHQQLETLDPYYKHPFYMDRSKTGTANGQQGGVGGRSNINQPNSSLGKDQAVLAGDDPLWPGREGAFGVLDPISEQFYICMRFNQTGGYGKYVGSKILVYCPRTKKGVVCTPGDYGPAGDTKRVAGVSPDAYWCLGAPNNDPVKGDPCYYGFVQQNTPLGPVDFSNAATNSAGLPQTNTNANTPVTVLPTAPVNYIPNWMKDPKLLKVTNNPHLYSYDFGWNHTGIPVDFTDPANGEHDDAGIGATTLFAGFRSEAAANAIWDEFREHFRTDIRTWQGYQQVYPKGTTADFHKKLDIFQRMLWQWSYGRGWIVKTADARVQVGSDAAVAADVFTGGLATPINGVIRDGANGVGNLVQSVVGFLNPFSSDNPGVPTGTTADSTGNSWTFGRATDLWIQFLTEWNKTYSNQDPTGWLFDDGNNGGQFPNTKQWMLAHAQFGSSLSGPIEKAVGAGVDLLTKGWNFLSHLLSDVKMAVSGIVNMIRIALQTITHNIQGVDALQQQANLMNYAFNDSIYFAAGPPGSLLFYADNPFTREYGEPVVEIREPFQRLHTIDSFKNIISNNISETTEEVGTVITATSNGQNPVTVYFDKGAPTEHQISKQIDTDLFWDKPTSLTGWLFHPVKSVESLWRMYNKWESGYSDETSAKRVALYHLKENLKNIYGGEIIILGDPSIRPHDLCWIGDSFSRIYGGIEVEQVVHHFTPDLGFVTSITPNAIVTINDPGRWSVMYQLHQAWAVQHAQFWLKKYYSTNTINTANGPVTATDLASLLQTQLLGHIKYNSGPAHALTAVAGLAAVGGLIGNTVGLGIGAFLGWKAWDWVKNNLLDQHGADLWYLNKNGEPMEAGLSYNSGVAVGSMSTVSFMNNALFPFHLSVSGQNTANGVPVISPETLLQATGWSTVQSVNAYKEVNLYSNMIKAKLVDIANKTDSGLPNSTLIDVYLCLVTGVASPDVIFVEPLTNSESVLAGKTTINITSLPQIKAPNGVRLAGLSPPPDSGVPDSVSFAKQELITVPGKLGVAPVVAIRVDRSLGNNGVDEQGRIMGYIFHNGPLDNDQASREQLLYQYANNPLLYPWDGYLADGRPLTYNWDAVINNQANIDTFILRNAIAGQGTVVGSGGSLVALGH